MQAALLSSFRAPPGLPWAVPPVLRPAPVPTASPKALPPHEASRLAAELAVPQRVAEPQQWLWQSRFGTIVIEVRGSEVYVNGDRVVPHAP